MPRPATEAVKPNMAMHHRHPSRAAAHVRSRQPRSRGVNSSGAEAPYHQIPAPPHTLLPSTPGTWFSQHARSARDWAVEDGATSAAHRAPMLQRYWEGETCRGVCPAPLPGVVHGEGWVCRSGMAAKIGYAERETMRMLRGTRN
jgi:hypothetical protein